MICKNVQISTNGDEIMAMYKLNMLYEMNIKYIYSISSLFPSISVPRLLLKKEMFMRSCWLSRRSRAVLTWSTVRIFPLTYIHTYLHTRDMYLLFPKHCPVPWMSSFLQRKNYIQIWCIWTQDYVKSEYTVECAVKKTQNSIKLVCLMWNLYYRLLADNYSWQYKTKLLSFT